PHLHSSLSRLVISSLALLISLPTSLPPPSLPPFPTRRSSDLASDVAVLDRLVVFLSFGSFHARRVITRGPPRRLLYRGVDRKRRSEEHTSELQSHLNLVCRLLLEKKKNKYISSIHTQYINTYT